MKILFVNKILMCSEEKIVFEIMNVLNDYFPFDNTKT